MATYFLYTNAIGVHLLDGSFKIVEEQRFKPAEQQKTIVALAAGQWLPAEQAMLKKRSADTIIPLAQKEPLQGPHAKIICSQDIEKFTKISEAMAKQLPQLRDAALAYTRVAIREGFRKDTLIIQAISTIDDLDRIANTMVKRLREWYGYYNPEFSVENSKKFCELILTKSREVLLKESGVRESMGAAFDQRDLAEIRTLAEEVLKVYALQERELIYVGKLMDAVCPNVHAVAGTHIGAKLLALAGGMQNLAKYPASTLQLLGAEKAMFRHLKTGARSPRFGILAQHIIVARAKEKEKGRIARVLADKTSIAARVDHFGGKPIGEKLKKDIVKKYGVY